MHTSLHKAPIHKCKKTGKGICISSPVSLWKSNRTQGILSASCCLIPKQPGAHALEAEGFAVDLCHDGSEGLLLALQALHDLILLDRMLPGQILSRTQIIGNVWGPGAEIEDGNLDNYIYLLRKKLSALPTKAQIKTIHRQGYCLTRK